MFSLQGKISRSTYWQTSIINLFTLLVIVGGDIAIYKGLEGLPTVTEGVLRMIFLVSFILALPAFWFLIAITVKRLHDRNRSGWFTLVAFTGVGLLWLIYECGFLPAQEEKPETHAITQPATTQPVPSITQPTSEKKVEVSSTPEAPVPKTEPVIQQPIVRQPAPQKVEEKKPETPAPQATAPQTPPQVGATGTEGKADTTAPYTVPPVRSMAEMLAELQRLSQQAPVAKKIVPPVKPSESTTPATAPSAQATPVTPEAKTPQADGKMTQKEKEQLPVSALQTTLEDTPAPETKDDLTSALNNIMAEAEKTAGVEDTTTVAVDEAIIQPDTTAGASGAK
jgi:uncharacterized membrane protein YhaH (DUF805 family)